MRAEQRWSGLAAGILGRAVRFASGLVIATLCLRAFGSEPWGASAIALAMLDLFAVLDFAVPELCVYEAAKIVSPEVLARRLGQALWLLAPPIVLGSGALWLISELSGTLVFRAQRAQAGVLSALLFAGACGFPFLLFANALSGTLQGLGRLREMNAMHALSAILELTFVVAAVQADRSLVEVQWYRTAAQALRCGLFMLSFRYIGTRVPRPHRPRLDEIRGLAAYCSQFSVMKVLGSALQRANVPVAQAFTGASVLGAYDAIDRLGSVVHRAANPVWDMVFHRLVRAFGPGADLAERAAGRRDFMAGTSILVGLSACATLGVVSLAPCLFPVWLGERLAREPIAFAPWVFVAWSLNLTTSMCTAVLSARARFSVCSVIHAWALGINIAVIVGLGIHEQGRYGLLAGPVVGNAALALGLAIAGCREAGVPVRAFWSRVLRLWIPVAAALGLQALLPGGYQRLHLALAVCALGSAGVLAILSADASLRSLAREFKATKRDASA